VVMGCEKGLALIEQIPDVEGLIIVRDPKGSFKDVRSTGFTMHAE